MEMSYNLIDKEIDTTFDCGNDSINRTIKESYYLTILQHASTYEFSCKGIILGYYMIMFRKIDLSVCPENISEYYSERMDYCISVHIDYLAVAKRFQGKGIGTSVLKTILLLVRKWSAGQPIRLITIDALKEYYDWYRKNGFLPFDEKDLNDDSATIRMYIDCITNENLEKIYSYQMI